MAVAPTVRADAIARALTAAGGANAPSDVQREVIVGVVGEPGQKTRGALWIILVSGLLLLLGAALGAVIYVIAWHHGDPDKLITLFTAVLTGLIGLFAPSPISRGRG